MPAGKTILSIATSFLLLLAGCGFGLFLAGQILPRFAPGYDGPATENFDGRYFHGPGPVREKRSFGSFFLKRLTVDPATVGIWPEHVPVKTTVPPKQVDGQAMRITWVGHATFLIQTEGLNILTDPFYSERASPVAWAGPKRVADPGVRWDDLPKIDVVLISHGHYDHLDRPTLEKLWRRDRPRIITPLGHHATITKQDPTIETTEVNWDQPVKIGPVSFILQPMQHWSARSPFDRNRALWGAWVIQATGGNVYFLADSGYGDGGFIRDTTLKYGPWRMALIPIGAYLPRESMIYNHMNPEEAVKAHQDMGQPLAWAHQHETVDMIDEGYDDPRRDLDTAREKAGEEALRFTAPRIGEAMDVPAL